MQVSYRSNPKTTGWAKRAAVAMLVGAGSMVFTLPISFFVLLTHYEHTTPNDTQNMLGALTISVVIGLAVAVFCGTAAIIIFTLMGVYKPVPEAAI
jgi:hypothetical protein